MGPTWCGPEPEAGMVPGAGVVSREFGEELGGRVVIEGSQTGAIVIGDEGVEIGIAFGMVDKAAMVNGTVLRHAFEVLGEAAVEALDHAERDAYLHTFVADYNRTRLRSLDYHAPAELLAKLAGHNTKAGTHR